ncbi:hypothetical protein C8Q75DRAFT_731756 [Abortiporus biennis]|nr:hypothetical protein C8Q75DRAFT_731756 [Abortiporus biennis]
MSQSGKATRPTLPSLHSLQLPGMNENQPDMVKRTLVDVTSSNNNIDNDVAMRDHCYDYKPVHRGYTYTRKRQPSTSSTASSYSNQSSTDDYFLSRSRSNTPPSSIGSPSPSSSPSFMPSGPSPDPSRNDNSQRRPTPTAPLIPRHNVHYMTPRDIPRDVRISLKACPEEECNALLMIIPENNAALTHLTQRHREELGLPPRTTTTATTDPNASITIDGTDSTNTEAKATAGKKTVLLWGKQHIENWKAVRKFEKDGRVLQDGKRWSRKILEENISFHPYKMSIRREPSHAKGHAPRHSISQIFPSALGLDLNGTGSA